MNTPKYLLPLLLSALGSLPLSAQTAPKDTLNQKVTQAVQRAQAADCNSNCTCAQQREEPLSAKELVDAETELQFIRDHRDSNATFSKYPYLLDPAYRRRNDPPAVCNCHMYKAQTARQQEPLTPSELIDAETELQLIRTRQDSNATFDKYPYLLDPAYRRGDESIRQQYRQQKKSTQTVCTNRQDNSFSRTPGWKRKVGL